MASQEPSHSVKKSKRLLGVAKISLEKLDFQNALRHEHREESKKALKRLVNIFELEGCRRFEEEHFIDALISKTNFEISLHKAGLTESSSRLKWQSVHDKDGCIAELDPPGPVHCLNGLHRLGAAQEYLDNNDRWWVVRLYDETGI